MVGCCCGCFSKKSRVKQQPRLKSATSQCYDPRDETETTPKLRTKSTQSCHNEQALQLQTLPSSYKQNMRFVPSEESTFTADTSGAAYGSSLITDNGHPLPQLHQDFEAPRVTTKVVETEELSPSEKLFLKYKIQMTTAKSKQENDDKSSSDSSLDRPPRNIRTPRCRTAACSRASAKKSAKKKDANFVEFPSDSKPVKRYERYQAPTASFLNSLRKAEIAPLQPLGRGQIPPGYGPPEGALLRDFGRQRASGGSRSQQRRNFNSRPNNTATSISRSPSPQRDTQRSSTHMFRGFGSKSAKKKQLTVPSEVKPRSAPPQAPLESTSEIALRESKSLSPQSGSFTIGRSSISCEPSNKSGDGSVSVSDHRFDSHGETSNNEIPRASPSLSPSPVVQRSVNSGSFTPADSKASSNSGSVAHGKTAEVLFKHPLDPPHTPNASTLKSPVTLPHSLQPTNAVGQPHSSDAAALKKQPPTDLKKPDLPKVEASSHYDLPVPSTPPPDNKKKLEPKNTNKDPPDSVSSSLTSFPESEDHSPNNNKIQHQARKSHRRKPIAVEETLNQIARDLRRQNKVLEQYRMVLTGYYKKSAKVGRSKNQGQQTSSRKKGHAKVKINRDKSEIPEEEETESHEVSRKEFRERDNESSEVLIGRDKRSSRKSKRSIGHHSHHHRERR